MKKTKIICTLGPACNDVEILKKMILGGMNVARVNFSHGTHESNKILMDKVKIAREELGIPVAIILDNKGPEVRMGLFENGKIELKQGQTFTLTTRGILGNEEIVNINYEGLPQDVVVGGKILLDDGLIELIIESITDTDIICKVLNGEALSNNKSLNIPDAKLNLPALTDKDVSDILFGIENEVDFVAASFVRSAQDVIQIRKLLSENGGEEIKIISKIENRTGVENVDSIIKESDGIMVARGDLGVEIPIEEIPAIQKNLIKKCYEFGKPVITATQMLDSMMRNPRPTRAEVTDVANAIYDGTSAIMLSGETSVGKYVLETVATMTRIAIQAEEDINYKKRFLTRSFEMRMSVTNAISHATCATAHDIEASAIIAVTISGNTARMVSKFRPMCPIITATTKPIVQRQLNLSWGVIPLLAEMKDNYMDLFDHAVNIAVSNGYVSHGDIVVITAGLPSGTAGTTNALKVHVVGDVLVEGNGVGEKTATGVVCVIKDKDGLKNYEECNILVISQITDELIPIIESSSGVIVENYDISSMAARKVLDLKIPVIIGANNATSILKQGIVVTIDEKKGMVYNGIIK